MQENTTNYSAQELGLLDYLLENGNHYQIHQSKPMTDFAGEASKYLTQLGHKVIKIEQKDKFVQIFCEWESGLRNKIGLGKTVWILVLQNQKELIVSVVNEKAYDGMADDKISESFFRKLFGGTDYSAVIEEIERLILHRQHATEWAQEQLRLPEMPHAAHILWLQQHILADDVFLFYRPVDHVSKEGDKLENAGDCDWYLLATSTQIALLAWHPNFAKIDEYPLHSEIKHKRELLRETFVCDGFHWQTDKDDRQLLKQIATIALHSPADRIRLVVQVYNRQGREWNTYKHLVERLIKHTGNPYDKLAKAIQEIENVVLNKGNDMVADEQLKPVLEQILEFEKSDPKLVQWAQDWNLSPEELVVVLQLLRQISDTPQLQELLLDLHRYIGEYFGKVHKNDMATLLFEMRYVEHLLDAGHTNEAEKVINKNLKKLPDESLFDLLPYRDSEEAVAISGQVVRIRWLELLDRAATDENQLETRKTLAGLQPLNPQKLQQLSLVAQNGLLQRVNYVRAMLFEGQNTLETPAFAPLADKTADAFDQLVQHPAARQNGMTAKLQHWLADVSIPDYSMVKAYAAPLDPDKYPQLAAFIVDTQKFLEIDELEVYVVHGEKSHTITAFEGKPAFLIIGSDYLPANSTGYHTLSYLIASELAHLRYKHARITSTDIWRGAREKGFTVLDSLLTLVPVVSFVGSAAKSFSRMSALSSLLHKSEKIFKAGGKSIELFDAVARMMRIFGSKKKSGQNLLPEQELLIASRMMQITADRAAFILSGNKPEIAVRAILRQSGFEAARIEELVFGGLAQLWKAADAQKDPVVQQVMLRLAALVSFYLSGE